ncbi:MAG: FecR family protein [Deltaproteobacteria bacterium]|nr:FecR family protein [Deltaproteobacteria bacterium]
MKQNFKIGLILILFFVISPVAFAQTVGHLIITKGRVLVHHKTIDKVYDKLKVKIKISRGDEIHSQDDSRGEVYLRKENEVIQLYSETFLRVDSVASSKTEISMPIGKARFQIDSKKRRGRRFQIRTTNALIAVKGTDFVVQSDGDKTEVLTVDGLVSLANLENASKTVNIPKRNASRTVRAFPPSLPSKVSEDTVKDILEQSTFDDWDDIDFKKTPEEMRSETSSQAVDVPKIEEMYENLDQIQTQVKQVQETVDQVESVIGSAGKTVEIIITNP